MKYYAGIDSGSTTTKIVIVEESGTIVASEIVPSGSNLRKSADVAFENIERKHHISKDQIERSVPTGYGRFLLGVSSKPYSEITCCARGVFALCPAARTIIDVGGQDCKVIRSDHNGKVKQFSLNDKCAAGTGRFLERIAVSLGLELDQMVRLSLASDSKISISNTCTVFAETEVISRVSSGEDIGNIVKGLHYSLASRIGILLLRLGLEREVFMCGGGALNIALLKELSEVIGAEIIRTNELDCRLVTALGAALMARSGQQASLKSTKEKELG